MENPVIDTQRKIIEFQETARGFALFIRRLPETDLVRKAWGAREVLTHEIFWVENYVTQVKAILSGETPLPPKGQFDDLNAKSIATNQGATVAELLNRFEVACDWLIEACQKHDPAQIVFTLKQGSAYRHSLLKHLKGESGHIRSHQEILERQIQRTYVNEVDTLAHAVDNFCLYIEKVPEKQLIEQEWGAREVLVHLIYWHELYVNQIEAIKAGEPAEKPHGSVMELNARAIRASRNIPISELLPYFREIDIRLRNYITVLDPQMFILKGQATPQTLDGILEYSIRHIQGHLNWLKKHFTPA